MKLKSLTILALAITIFMSACGKSDADLTKAATDKLAADKVVGVKADVKSGVATLTGEVADITVKNKAEASVKTVDGIKSVDNKITLAPVKPAETPSPDKLIEGNVNEAIKKTGITGVTATIADGEITLTGEVKNTGDLATVMKAASEAKGNAKKINNKVTVKK